MSRSETIARRRTAAWLRPGATLLIAALLLGSGLPAFAEEAAPKPAQPAQPPSPQQPAPPSADPGPPGEPPPPPDASSITTHLFSRNLMSDVHKPAHFTYDLKREAKGEDPVSGHVLMDVREVRPDGGKAVYFKIDGGIGPYDFGPVEASNQNPVVIVYLQADVVRLQRLTGGSQQYFRSRIRMAFNGPARVEPVEITYKDKTFKGERMTIQPFTGDEHLKEHPEIRDKSYAFTVVPDLPGGLYQVATRVPNPSGDGSVEDDSLTLADVTPAE